MTGKELAQVLNKFLTSPHAQWARVQIELPNGMIGDRDTHRINIKGVRDPYPKMGRIIGKL
jgi:hypothetical protein